MRRRGEVRHMTSKKAVFVGKRTVLEGERSPATAGRLARGAQTALPLLHASGFRIIVVSNEPGIAHGRYTERSLNRVESELSELLDAAGAPLAHFYYCPHHPAGSETLYAFDCDCRMPQCGLLLQAAAAMKLELGACWLIGDTLDEIESGHMARCRAVLVDDGQELEWRSDELRRPDGIADDLAEAALIIASSARGGIRA